MRETTIPRKKLEPCRARGCRALALGGEHSMNMPERYDTLPRVELEPPRRVGRPRGPAGSQATSRIFMLCLDAGWTEEQELTVKEKGADKTITRELVGPRTLATGQLCACFALTATQRASWLNRNVIEGTWFKSSRATRWGGSTPSAARPPLRKAQHTPLHQATGHHHRCPRCCNLLRPRHSRQSRSSRIWPIRRPAAAAAPPSTSTQPRPATGLLAPRSTSTHLRRGQPPPLETSALQVRPGLDL